MSTFRNLLINKNSKKQFDYSLLTFEWLEQQAPAEFSASLSTNIREYPDKYNYLTLKCVNDDTKQIEYLTTFSVNKDSANNVVVNIDSPSVCTGEIIWDIFFLDYASPDRFAFSSALGPRFEGEKKIDVQIITENNQVIFDSWFKFVG